MANWRTKKFVGGTIIWTCGSIVLLVFGIISAVNYSKYSDQYSSVYLNSRTTFNTFTCTNVTSSECYGAKFVDNTCYRTTIISGYYDYEKHNFHNFPGEITMCCKTPSGTDIACQNRYNEMNNMMGSYIQYIGKFFYMISNPSVFTMVLDHEDEHTLAILGSIGGSMFLLIAIILWGAVYWNY